MADVVQVTGARELRSTLQRAARELGDMEQANRSAAQTVATTAGQRAPRRTGRLAASARVTATDTTGTVTFGVVYASPINWGVGPRRGLRGPHNIRPTHFATDAPEATEGEWTNTYQRAAQGVLDRVRGA